MLITYSLSDQIKYNTFMKLLGLIGLRDWYVKPGQEKDKIFEDVIGYDDIKRVFRMALESNEPIHILLIGPPASAKTLFLEALMHKVGDKKLILLSEVAVLKLE